MLKIRAHQIAALRDVAKTRFADRVVQQLRLDLPRSFADLPASQARAKVLAEMENARLFGLETEREVFRYVALAIAFGADFMRRQWALPILKDPSLTRPSERIAGMWDSAPPPGSPA
jgi:hypothetical protein